MHLPINTSMLSGCLSHVSRWLSFPAFQRQFCGELSGKRLLPTTPAISRDTFWLQLVGRPCIGEVYVFVGRVRTHVPGLWVQEKEKTPLGAKQRAVAYTWVERVLFIRMHHSRRTSDDPPRLHGLLLQFDPLPEVTYSNTTMNPLTPTISILHNSRERQRYSKAPLPNRRCRVIAAWKTYRPPAEDMKRDGDNVQQNEGGQSDRVEGDHDAALQPLDDDELSVIQNSIATPVRLRHRWYSPTMDQHQYMIDRVQTAGIEIIVYLPVWNVSLRALHEMRIGETGAHQQSDGRSATALSMMSKYMPHIKAGLEAISRVAASGRAGGQARKRTNAGASKCKASTPSVKTTLT
ncbi:hypothetical protein POSPLADRAFT_1034595 [Postia placenta MAD-698-R-SB12]|uniref:Uncharacterized protein n=1 Tax=Postia placenta MAD-698-R-SB12 TaxID=670580 RepID=A0A1X6MXI7_9APHY|nr:hypothetical protein POSPLADRAFT_1034595 [Postia placenta MAD-698-R-SB12]OSX61071.1 hypothetical protein POSPLADRAFT_1034595 [Postia placenta MAD-698-R-SB12]